MDILDLPHYQVIDHAIQPRQYSFLVRSRAPLVGHCPKCGTLPEEFVREGYQPFQATDAPIRGKRVALHIDRARFRCKGCGNRSIFEELPDIHPSRQLTNRCADWIVEAATTRTFAIVARETGLDEGTIRNVFGDYMARWREQYRFETPRVLGIDEKRLLKKLRFVVGNIEKSTLLDVLDDRYNTTIGKYFLGLDDPSKVEVVCMDLNKAYRKLAKHHFKKATIVADRFHVVRLMTQAFDKARVAVTSGASEKDRKRLRLHRKLLLARYDSLEDDGKAKVDEWLGKYEMLKYAHRVKEDFYRVYECKDPHSARTRYYGWQRGVPSFLTKYFDPVSTAFKNWPDQIFAYFDHLYTNAYIERVNGLMAEMQFAGRGYSFEVIRAKALLSYGTHRIEIPKFNKRRDVFAILTGDVHAPLPIDYGADLDALIAIFRAEREAA